MSPGARVSIVVLFALTLAIGGANLLFTTSQVGHVATVVHKQDVQARAQAATIAQLRAQQAQLSKQQQAACAVAADVGSAPLPASPKPSKLGVSLVVDFRHQWRTLHCPGSLPVPPGLARWAAYYHLPGN